MRLSNFLTTSQNVRKAADQANCDGKWHTASQKTLLYKNDLCGRNSSTESIINKKIFLFGSIETQNYHNAHGTQLKALLFLISSAGAILKLTKNYTKLCLEIRTEKINYLSIFNFRSPNK